MKQIKCLVLVLFFLSGLQAEAGKSVSATVKRANAAGDKAGKPDTSDEPKGPDIHNSAASGQQQNQAVSQAAGMAGSILMAQGLTWSNSPEGSTRAKGYALLGLAALAYMQSAGSGQTAGDMGAVKFATQKQPVFVPKNPSPGGGGWDSTTSKGFNDTVGRLKSQGYKVNSNGTITSPTGKILDANTLSTDSGLASLGLDANQRASVKAELKKALDKAQAAMDSPKAYDTPFSADGGGGGGSMGGAGGLEEEKVITIGGGGRMSDEELRKAASVEGQGLYKTHEGDMIGIANDDIFKMITRRYQSEKKNNRIIVEP